MKFTLFFAFISSIFCYFTYQQHFLFLWPSINMVFFCIIYLLNQPTWLHKSQTGKINNTIYIVNLPWLLLSAIVWHIQRIFSHELASNAIDGTNIAIGRRLLNHELPKNIEIVIDLTSELNAPYYEAAQYVNIPLLDGTPPPNTIFTQLKVLLPQIKNKQIYIHCAQGHGRTAMITSLLLVMLDYCKTTEAAYKTILEHRPNAKLATKQLKFVQFANGKLCND